MDLHTSQRISIFATADRRKTSNGLSRRYLDLILIFGVLPEGLPFRFDAPTIDARLNFTLNTDCGLLVVLGEVSGIGGFARAQQQSDVEEMFGLPIQTLSLDGLIVAKTAAGRSKDKLHLLELQELKKLRESGGV